MDFQIDFNMNTESTVKQEKKIHYTGHLRISLVFFICQFPAIFSGLILCCVSTDVCLFEVLF